MALHVLFSVELPNFINSLIQSPYSNSPAIYLFCPAAARGENIFTVELL
jgi:hypothetical protein